MRQGAFEDALERLVTQRRELDNPHAREQRSDEREPRVLGRRAHEHDRPVFDVRQKRILLRTVEAVDLIDEQQRALLAQAPRVGAGDHLAHVLHARRHGRQRLERHAAASGEEPRQRGLAGAGGPPQNEARHVPAGERRVEQAALHEDRVLSADIGQLLRSQAIGQGRAPGGH